MLGGNFVEAFSAGSRPSGVVNPKAIEAMSELGYDLSVHRSKSLSEIPSIEYDFVATMGCGDDCPNVRARARQDWTIRDPKELGPDDFQSVRDEIGAHVRRTLANLGVLRN